MDEAVANQIDVLFPDRELEIAGRRVTVREFTFMETLKLRPIAHPIIQEMVDLGESQDAISYEEALDVLAHHDEAFIALIARACGQDVDWVRGLDEKEGSLLSNLFWVVNQDFFTRRLLEEMRRRQAKKSAGGGSSTS